MIKLARLCGVVLIALGLVAGCASRKGGPAPVEDRGTSVGRQSVPAGSGAQAPSGAEGPAPVAPAPKQPPGFENAGKPGYYTVKPGDTMIRIGLEQGQNWRDIARWSGVDNPNQIEVGQVLRVVPPVAEPSAAATDAPATPTGVVTKPVVVGSVPSQGAAPPPAAAASAPAASKPAAAAPGPDEVEFLWPANGDVIAGFDEAKNKGVDIAGKAGDAVIAAADGRVVYAGSGLRGYGNLIIVKHNNTYLTAYAHNQALLVKEDQPVKRGQRIAEMGNSDADRVKLHFEIRRQGKPVDPAKYLPAR